MFKPISMITAGLLLAGSAQVFAADEKAEPTDKVADLLNDAIDPYVPGNERGKFLKLAGVDSELDQDEFEAGAKIEDSFVRGFDRWASVAPFDKNGNKKVDWFEVDAYRRDLRARMMAEYDKNKDGKLEGAERDAIKPRRHAPARQRRISRCGNGRRGGNHADACTTGPAMMQRSRTVEPLRTCDRAWRRTLPRSSRRPSRR